MSYSVKIPNISPVSEHFTDDGFYEFLKVNYKLLQEVRKEGFEMWKLLWILAWGDPTHRDRKCEGLREHKIHSFLLCYFLVRCLGDRNFPSSHSASFDTTALSSSLQEVGKDQREGPETALGLAEQGQELFSQAVHKSRTGTLVTVWRMSAKTGMCNKILTRKQVWQQ